jgi:hypothetical protein
MMDESLAALFIIERDVVAHSIMVHLKPVLFIVVIVRQLVEVMMRGFD